MSPTKDFLLIVDDEEAVLQSIKEFLEEKEYSILTSGSGEEALKILKEKSDKITLVISDQRMPGMNGSEFLEKVAQKYPLIATILLTGFSDLEPAVAAINKARVTYYIQKEDMFKELENAIKKGLGDNKRRIMEARAKKMTSEGPSVLTNFQVMNVGVVSDESHQMALMSGIPAFQMNLVQIPPEEFNKKWYDGPENLHALFVDVDLLGWDKVPPKPSSSGNRSSDGKEFPYVIAVCSDAKKFLPEMRRLNFYDCLDTDFVKDIEKLSHYLMQLPSIGEREFKRVAS